jgi:hypothetical protein
LTKTIASAWAGAAAISASSATQRTDDQRTAWSSPCAGSPSIAEVRRGPPHAGDPDVRSPAQPAIG